MIIGVPKETKVDEYRVALVPVGAEELVKHGHRVLVEKGAGLGSGITDEEYIKAGAKLVNGIERIYEEANMVLKVKEPLPEEYTLLREGQIVFTFFHFAAS
ncbi:MAG TPA: alanine dehydrogenase, partial [Candidatus Hypogeohydataceae bacterium YC38]